MTRKLKNFFNFKTAALALHAGFLLALLTLLLKAVAPGMKGEVELVKGECARLEDRILVLKRFTIDHWPSGKISQYTSDVHLMPGQGADSGTFINAAISVNHPLRYKGWWVYQTSYDPDCEGKTILTAFRDPYLPLAALAGVLLLVGAVQLVCRRWSPSRAAVQIESARVRAGLIAGGIAFSLVPIYFIGKSCFKADLMPALQSPLLFPHILAYLAGYVILLFAAFGLLHRLIPLGFAFMTLGLVLGALWGKICWGDWWQYDPKEMWSLATWLVYAAYFHIRGRVRVRTERIWLAAGAVMIILTLTWVNLSRLWTGMHSYV